MEEEFGNKSKLRGSGRQAFLDWIKNSTDAIVEFIDAGKNAIGTIRDIGGNNTGSGKSSCNCITD